MKKMLTLAMGVAAAIFANAASVDWSMANGVLTPSPDGSATAGRASYYTMLIFTADQSTAVDAAIAGGSFSSLSDIAVSKSQAAKAGTFGATINGLNGSEATIFAVVFDTYSATETIADAGYYYKTGMLTQSTYDPAGSDPATKAVFTATQMTGTWTSTGVPEPTSGLLLLLGMAGLALKRKQA